LIYSAVKSGIGVNITDMSLACFYDFISYSAKIDSVTLAKSDGKNISYSAPQSVSDMLAKGKVRG
jgi:hypothetical protein